LALFEEVAASGSEGRNLLRIDVIEALIEDAAAQKLLCELAGANLLPLISAQEPRREPDPEP
jgi:hypothetical protein